MIQAANKVILFLLLFLYNVNKWFMHQTWWLVYFSKISYPKIGDHSIRTGPEAFVMSSFIVLPFKG
jgi:hypothetical protein